MTVETTSSYSTGTGNGAATSFPFTFACRSEAEIDVYLDRVQQFSGFTVTLSPDFSGGTVAFTTAPANGVAVLIESDPSFAQEISFENAGAYSPKSVDGALDAGAIRDIYLKGLVGRSLRFAPGEEPNEITAWSNGQFLAKDAAGNPVGASGTGADAGLRTDLAAPTGASLVGGSHRTVATRAALAALNGTVFPSAVLTESGREGLFAWSSANLSTQVALDTRQGIYVAPASDTTGASGAWVRKYNGWVDSRWFGAIGDGGVTDSTAAIQTALNVAAGGIVLLPPVGKCGVTTLEIPTDTGLVGYGMASGLFQLAGATDSAIKLGSARTALHVYLSNFSIDGNKANQTTANVGVAIENQNSVSEGTRHLLDRLWIRNCKGTGVLLGGFSRGMYARNLVIYACDARGFQAGVADSQFTNIETGRSGTVGIYIGVGPSVFTGLKSWYSGDVDRVSSGIEVHGTGTEINGAWTQDNQGKGLRARGDTAPLLGLVVSGFTSDNDNVRAAADAAIELDNVKGGVITGSQRTRPVDPGGQGGVQHNIVYLMNGCVDCQVNVSGDGTQSSYAADADDMALFASNDVRVKARNTAIAAGQGATINPNSWDFRTFKRSLTGNTAVNNPGKNPASHRISFYFTQDAIGNRTVTWGSAYKVLTAISATANYTTIIEFECDGTYWWEVGSRVIPG